MSEEFPETYQRRTGLLLVSIRFRWEVGADLVEKFTGPSPWTHELDGWTKSKQSLRELPVQKNLADTSENSKNPMNGQLKAKPEIEKCRTLLPAWKEVNTETTTSSSDDQTVFSTTKSSSNRFANSTTYQHSTSGQGPTRWPTVTTFNRL